MDISLKRPYKSLTSFDLKGLPDLVILTGVNGSGKTHLLSGMAERGLIKVFDSSGRELSKKKYVDSRSLAPNESAIISWEQLKQGPQKAWNAFDGQYRKRRLSNPGLQINNVIADSNIRHTIEQIALNCGKAIDDLKSDDFFNYYPLVDRMDQSEIFHQSFSQIFKRYQIHQQDNDFNEFRNNKYGGYRYLSKDAFLKTFGEPPWDFVNKLLSEASLDYRIESPKDLHRDAPFELKLLNSHSQQIVTFSDLSGGEKVLMSLALSLYNSTFDLDFPEVLLMDEPDAPLHPTMTSKFLSVIQNVFVRDKGVKVFVSTHSPSTVALSPEEFLYEVRKTAPRIQKTTKDQALTILTEGLPSLSIRYENRRQIFVESKHDVAIYERMLMNVANRVNREISLNFISSGIKGSGSCEHVVDIVDKLTNNGNDTVFGIVDWDLKNKSSGPIFVLSEGSRYSLENLIFDPVAFAAFLIREAIVDKSLFGLTEEEAYFDIKCFDEDRLSKIASIFLGEISPKMDSSNSETIDCRYCRGHSLALPIWYLHSHGHTLEDILKEKWPSLRKFHSEGALKIAVSERLYADLPDLIPLDFLNLFLAIQSWTRGVESASECCDKESGDSAATVPFSESI